MAPCPYLPPLTAPSPTPPPLPPPPPLYPHATDVCQSRQQANTTTHVLAATCSYSSVSCFSAEAGLLLSSSQAHSRSINTVHCLPASQGSLALSAGKDHSIRLWSIPAQQARPSAEQEPLSCAAVYKGHTDAVEAVAGSPSGSSFCSGSWDASVNIWRTGQLPCSHACCCALRAPKCSTRHVLIANSFIGNGFCGGV